MMADQEQLDRLLNNGVEIWNKWLRDYVAEHNDFVPIDLSGVDLGGKNLDGVIFAGASLEGANLRRTRLGGSNLIGAQLNGADLTEASLVGAVLTGADLTDAIFNKTDLINANLRETTLNKTDFTNAILGDTIFGNVDLSVANGLKKADHRGSSTIGIETFYRSQGNIPEAFLKGAGVPDSFLEYMHSLVGKPVEYYSCFISYSSKDEALAKRLYADLQSNDVRCWYAPEDLKWGAYIRMGINEGIRLHDKLLLVLSKHSIASGWIEHEVKIARAREKKENKPILFPVRIDKAIFDCPFAWATEIRHERNIGDFTRWKNHDDYEKAFSRLLHDLKEEAEQPELGFG